MFFHGKVRQEAIDVQFRKLPGMRGSAELDVLANPVDVSLLSSLAVMMHPEHFYDAIVESRLGLVRKQTERWSAWPLSHGSTFRFLD